MGQLSSKLRSVEMRNGGEGIAFWCPGCNGPHTVGVKNTVPLWTFNGDVEKPTFRASVLIRIEWSKSMQPGDDPKEWQDEVCHSFVTDGNIQFLGDCTHKLSGQTVPLPDWPSEVTGMRKT